MSTQAATVRSMVVLSASIHDPLEPRRMVLTRSTVVRVEHFSDDALTKVVEMALEIAPDVEEWDRYA